MSGLFENPPSFLQKGNGYQVNDTPYAQTRENWKMAQTLLIRNLGSFSSPPPRTNFRSEAAKISAVLFLPGNFRCKA